MLSIDMTFREFISLLFFGIILFAFLRYNLLMLFLIFNSFYCCRYTPFNLKHFMPLQRDVNLLINPFVSDDESLNWVKFHFCFISVVVAEKTKCKIQSQFITVSSLSIESLSNRNDIAIEYKIHLRMRNWKRRKRRRRKENPLESQVEWMQSIAAIHQKPLNIVNKSKRAKHQKWHYFYRCHFVKHEYKCHCCNISSVFFLHPVNV